VPPLLFAPFQVKLLAPAVAFTVLVSMTLPDASEIVTVAGSALGAVKPMVPVEFASEILLDETVTCLPIKEDP